MPLMSPIGLPMRRDRQKSLYAHSYGSELLEPAVDLLGRVWGGFRAASRRAKIYCGLLLNQLPLGCPCKNGTSYGSCGPAPIHRGVGPEHAPVLENAALVIF